MMEPIVLTGGRQLARTFLVPIARSIAAAAMIVRHTRVGFGVRVAFGHPIKPGRKPSGVRAARRAAAKRRNRARRR